MTPVWTDLLLDSVIKGGFGVGTPLSNVYLAMFQGSANPAGTPIELTDAWYSRQSLTIGYLSTGTVGNTNAVTYTSTTTGSFQGIGIYNLVSGTGLLAWYDLDTIYDYVVGTTIPFPAAKISFGLSNPS